MEQKQLSRFLMAAGLLASVGVIFVFAVAAPVLLAQMQPQWQTSPVFWIRLLYLCPIAALYLSALWQYMGVCQRIGDNRSFCAENARALDGMAKRLFLAAGLWLLYPVLQAVLGRLNRLIFPSLLLFLGSLAMGMLALGLGRLLTRVVRLQEENDLTI